MWEAWFCLLPPLERIEANHLVAINADKVRGRLREVRSQLSRYGGGFVWQNYLTIQSLHALELLLI
jgi:hypothetical protein